MLYKLLGRTQVEELSVRGDDPLHATKVPVWAPAWMPTATEVATWRHADRLQTLYYACHLYFTADSPVAIWFDMPTQDPLFVPLASTAMPLPSSLLAGLLCRYAISLGHPMGRPWVERTQATLPALQADGSVRPSDAPGLPPWTRNEVDGLLATICIAWHVTAAEVRLLYPYARQHAPATVRTLTTPYTHAHKHA
jgi:hypothetical protein